MIYILSGYIVRQTIKRFIIKSRKDSLRKAAIKRKMREKKGFNEIELHLPDTGRGYNQLYHKVMC